MSYVQRGLSGVGVAFAFAAATLTSPAHAGQAIPALTDPPATSAVPPSNALPLLHTGRSRPGLTTSGSAASSALPGVNPLRGSWRSEADETQLVTALQESVWGKGAKEVRTVRMTVEPDGGARLVVERRVVDARQRTAPGSRSIEEIDLAIGAVTPGPGVRTDHVVAIRHAERRYPEDPKGSWQLDGCRVTITTLKDTPNAIEVRVDTPDGRGTFWETLRRTSSSTLPSATRAMR